MRMVLLGPPGAGKGTHARLLKKRFQVPHIATGDLLRARVKDGSEMGKRAKQVMNEGRLVPDEIVIQMIRDRLHEADAKKGFILDGFPRTVEQAKALDTLLSDLSLRLSVVIDFNSSEEMIVSRLSGRRTCGVCGAVFHVKNITPKREGVCDFCGGALTRRKDDDPETVRERLKVYHRETEPLIDYYRKQGTLHTVSGDLDIEPLQKEFDLLFTSLALH